MDWFMTLITSLLFGFSQSSKVPPRKYYYINKKITWHEAQQYCREKYTDLATIEELDDLTSLKVDFSYSWVWVGLHDEPKSWKTSMGNDSNSWRWSATGETSQTGYQKWDSGEPSYQYAKETCVKMSNKGRWNDMDCNWQRSFLCYTVTENNKKNFLYISTTMTWDSAQEYCRKHYKDLAMIDNEAENTEASNLVQITDGAWIGLYRVPWTWSDNSQSSYRNWHSSLNNAKGNQHCGVKNEQHQLADQTCSYKEPFVCHQVLRATTTLRMTTITDADLMDPAINIQILQKLDASLRSQRLTDFKLHWKMQPKKKDKCEKSVCNSHV